MGLNPANLIQAYEPEATSQSGATLFLPYFKDMELDALVSLEMFAYSFGRAISLPTPGSQALRWVNGVMLSSTYGVPVWHDSVLVCVSASSDDASVPTAPSEGNIALYKNGSLEVTFTDIFNGSETVNIPFDAGDTVSLVATVTSGQNGISGPMARLQFRRERV